jgi:hypothetical protein
MKITESQLRKTIRQVIREAGEDPNMSTGLAQRLAPHIKDQALGYVPGASTVKSVYDAGVTTWNSLTDQEISKKYPDDQIAGFIRACKSLPEALRDHHGRGDHVSIEYIFNELLQQKGVNRYYIVDDDHNRAGEFPSIEDN